MSHYAQLDENNTVIFVIAAKSEGKEEEFTKNTGNIWKQTSYNTRGGVYYDPKTGEPSEDQSKAFRKNYAGFGFTYDSELDAFIPPKPFDSWVLDEETCLWEAPTPIPDYDKLYEWNETAQSWQVVSPE